MANLTIVKNADKQDLSKALIDLIRSVIDYRETTRKFLIGAQIVSEHHPAHQAFTKSQLQLDASLNRLTDLVSNMPRPSSFPPVAELPPELQPAEPKPFPPKIDLPSNPQTE